MTLLFVGHGLGAVNYVSDQIAVMYLGKIVEYGTSCISGISCLHCAVA